MTAPVVTSVGVPSAGTYSRAILFFPSLSFTVNFDQTIMMVSGTPRLKLRIGDNTGADYTTEYANYVSGIGTSSLTFSWTITAEGLDRDGIGIVELELNGGTIQNVLFENADLTLHSVGSTSAVFVNEDRPWIDSYYSPWGNYNTGQNVDFFVYWSEEVDITGSPQIALNGGRYAVCTGDTGSSYAVFRYTVQSGDTGNLSVAGTMVELSGGAIKDVSGDYNALLTLRGPTGAVPTMNTPPIWDTLNNNIPLFVQGLGYETDFIPLLVTGDEPSSGSMTLAMPDVDVGLITTALTLFVESHESSTESIPLVVPNTLDTKTAPITLFVWGEDASSGSLTLHTTGHDGVTGEIPLTTWGHLTATAAMPLFVKVDPPGESDALLSLVITGSLEDGIFAGIPLHTYADEFGQTPTRSMPLFLMAEDQSSAVAHMNLWVEGRTHAADGSLELVVWNDQEGAYQSIPLFVQGEGETDGAAPLTWSMNLVLQRDPANAITLYVQGPGEELTEAMTLYVEGEELSTATLDLSIPNVLGYVRQTVPLFVSGF